MDWYQVDRRLAPLFRGTARLGGRGYWIPATKPVPIGKLLDDALDDGDERDEFEGTFDDWSGHLRLVLEGTDARTEKVLSAFWSTAPGSSWENRLEIVGVEARSYLCSWEDGGGGYRAVALLEPGFDPDLIEEVADEVVGSNGAVIGEMLFFGLPPDELSTLASSDALDRVFEQMLAHDEDGEWAAYLGVGELS